ncbi:hypothetical protein PR002_g7047 [Phytophthora rubi]|uniref:Uncharacterized protein n=1 Tax=Phytophthora rubi TaxID=129364 RepID=A0A6A3N5H0_9STRA|nr:hypothetical protein PR002_g7047 [Phytophthora rubi]
MQGSENEVAAYSSSIWSTEDASSAADYDSPAPTSSIKKHRMFKTRAPARERSITSSEGRPDRTQDHDIRQLEEAEVIPRQLQQADVSAFPGPDRNACANMERANPHQHSQIVQIGCEVYSFAFIYY